MKKTLKCEFEFECPRDWYTMKPTSSENIRFCEVCSKNVYFCSNKNELESHTRNGDCVATYDFLVHDIERKELIKRQARESIGKYLRNKDYNPRRVGRTTIKD